MKRHIIKAIMAALVLMGGQAFAGEPRLRIAVRSEVDQPLKGWGKAPIQEHGKTYHLVYLKEHPAVESLAKPVAAETVGKALVAELVKQGFKAVPMDQIPDILLAADYGRDFLKNPYFKDVMAFGNTVILSGVAGVKYLMRQKGEVGFNEKVQDANAEKLFIRVIAWANPRKEPQPEPGKKVKLHEVWRTTVVIDNPVSRDLNLFVEKMLAAAGPLFDHPTKEEEAIINTELPPGYVKVGESKVVPSRPGDNEDGK